MNKRQKEVIEYNLQNEADVLKALESQYRKALADINRKIKDLQGGELTQSKIYHLQYQKTLKKQVEAIIEKLHSDEYTSIQKYLNDCYTNSFVGTMYDIAGQGIPIIAPIDNNAAAKAIILDSKVKEDLYTSIGVDITKLKRTIRNEITRGIASGEMYSNIARNISHAASITMNRANTIVRTEGHRIQQAATEDARQEAVKKGAKVVKQWDATLDGATRKTHRALDGQIRETNERFEADGKSAMYPGDFGDPAEDCNCRCEALTRARAAMDEEELQTLKDRASYFGLLADDSKEFGKSKAKLTFAGFKEKYLSASKRENEYNMVRAAKIEANGLFVNNTEKLYRYAQKIKPIEGYEDFTCHADADNFFIDLGGKGKADDFLQLTPEEYASRIKDSSTYKGGNVRIISCQAGAKNDGAAQKLADALGVDVYAPTETVHVRENGEMFVSDNDILAEMWYNEGEGSTIKETGKWKLFKPRKE